MLKNNWASTVMSGIQVFYIFASEVILANCGLLVLQDK